MEGTIPPSCCSSIHNKPVMCAQNNHVKNASIHMLKGYGAPHSLETMETPSLRVYGAQVGAFKVSGVSQRIPRFRFRIQCLRLNI